MRAVRADEDTFKERIVSIVVKADELCRASRRESEGEIARREVEEASHRETADLLREARQDITIMRLRHSTKILYNGAN